MIQLNILKSIIQHSDGIKFLIVVKETDLFKDDCCYLLKIIEFGLEILPKTGEIS
jgi:hypothetical protein